MKKIISFLLLLFLFPCYLTAHEVSIKLGAAFAEPKASEVKTKLDFNGISTSHHTYNTDVDLVASAITADFYYYAHENIYIGLGFNTELFRNTGVAYGNTSYFMPYISVKPNIDINEFNIYALAKLGTTFIHYENPDNLNIDTSQGLCYAFGIGSEYKSFIFEEVSNSDITQHTYAFNIGYKFSVFNRN